MNSRFAIGAIFVLVLVVGCGPGSDMGYVTGVVTLEGEPVGYADVAFYTAGGRPSVATTKSDGSYELVYTRDKKGALVGEHKVTIVQENPNQGVPEEERVTDFVSVKIPRVYTDKKTTDLTAKVINGSNEFDFDLKTK